MDSSTRLESYFKESTKHIEHMIEAKEELILPIDSYDNLKKIERFALNTLIFRFSKLQDLLGSKIFRHYLEYNGFSTIESSFFDILKELEKQSIIDIDSWNELRELRNDIAHDYPDEFDEMIQKINLFVKKSDNLIDIAKKLEQKYCETNSKRD